MSQVFMKEISKGDYKIAHPQITRITKKKKPDLSCMGDTSAFELGDVVRIGCGPASFTAKLKSVFMGSLGFFRKENGEIVIYDITEVKSGEE